ncbi:unnamed protein product [Linum trigynum]|uniref:Transmembrane protein n=1 Tax=Linum trigynum TaxID=586398 RepID=A0AAV2DTR7_9ROSI
MATINIKESLILIYALLLIFHVFPTLEAEHARTYERKKEAFWGSAVSKMAVGQEHTSRPANHNDVPAPSS